MEKAAIQNYFDAERAESVIFLAVGCLAIAIAIYCWFSHKAPFAIGLAWPLAIIALIQIGVGAGIFLRSPKDIERVNKIVAIERSRVQSEEIPRMNTVMTNFKIYRYLEIALVVLGFGLVFWADKASLWQGVGYGLALQAGLMLLLDFFAGRRGEVYLSYIKSVST